MKLGAFSSLLVTLAFVCSSVVNRKYVTATDAAFYSLIINIRNPVAVLFCAGNEPEYIQSKSALDQVVTSFNPERGPPKITMVYLDQRTDPKITEYFDVTIFPAFIGFYNGRPVSMKGD